MVLLKPTNCFKTSNLFETLANKSDPKPSSTVPIEPLLVPWVSCIQVERAFSENVGGMNNVRDVWDSTFKNMGKSFGVFVAEKRRA